MKTIFNLHSLTLTFLTLVVMTFITSMTYGQTNDLLVCHTSIASHAKTNNYYLTKLLGEFYNTDNNSERIVIEYTDGSYRMVSRNYQNGYWHIKQSHKINLFNISNEYFFEVVVTVDDSDYFVPIKYTIAGDKITFYSVNDWAVKELMAGSNRDIRETFVNNAWKSSIYKTLGSFHNIKSSNTDNTETLFGVAALTLLVGALLFGGDDNSSGSNDYKVPDKVLYGYDRDGSPVYNQNVPTYYDHNGNKKW